MRSLQLDVHGNNCTLFSLMPDRKLLCGGLCSTTKDLVTSADARSNLIILRFGVTRRVKVGKGR